MWRWQRRHQQGAAAGIRQVQADVQPRHVLRWQHWASKRLRWLHQMPQPLPLLPQGRASLASFQIEGCDMKQLAAELNKRHIAVRSARHLDG